jgi:hypothetical protein
VLDSEQTRSSLTGRVGGAQDMNKTMRGGDGLRQRVKASEARSLAT